MVALDGRFLDRAIHALDLAIGLKMLDLGQPMFDAILLAAHIEHTCRVPCRRAIRIARRESELDPIIGENRVDLVGDGRDRSFEEGRGRGPSRLLDQLHGRRTCWCDRWRCRGRACLQRSGPQRIDVEIADRISLEPFLEGLLPSTPGNRLMPGAEGSDAGMTASDAGWSAAARRGSRRAAAAYAAGKRR
jgi:hypothetical protein